MDSDAWPAFIDKAPWDSSVWSTDAGEKVRELPALTSNFYEE
jgi:hypothetical protein